VKSIDRYHTIQQFIHVIRGQKVMLDRDLAGLYGVKTFNLNKAVRRNPERFPAEFMFRLSKEEYASLRFQYGILKRGQHAKYLPFAFTQEGVAMLSSVLRSPRAIRTNIEIMRAFVKFRSIIMDRRQLAQRLDQLESYLSTHDLQIQGIFRAIRGLIQLPPAPKKKIGFHNKGGLSDEPARDARI
jgi:hypothetical protein